MPAGDVGCGPQEIGLLFEGFKSALHDLAMIAYGLKKSVAFLGNIDPGAAALAERVESGL